MGGGGTRGSVTGLTEDEENYLNNDNQWVDLLSKEGEAVEKGTPTPTLTEGDVEDSFFMDIDSKYQAPSQAPEGAARSAATAAMNANVDDYFGGLNWNYMGTQSWKPSGIQAKKDAAKVIEAVVPFIGNKKTVGSLMKPGLGIQWEDPVTKEKYTIDLPDPEIPGGPPPSTPFAKDQIAKSPAVQTAVKAAVAYAEFQNKSLTEKAAIAIEAVAFVCPAARFIAAIVKAVPQAAPALASLMGLSLTSNENE